MGAETSGAWLFLAMGFGAVGAGFFIYGVRQKEPWTLALGVLLNVLPFVITHTLALLACGIAATVGALYGKRNL